ncbi:2-C-methyl-D-erythritol 4-phosphate cytidylyltransferase [Jatrophihabitans endophyticus]|uniref:2-C-methyl-D-erythritol 4-phosphate cytidylyltransferase n=1 Tax=Jatrophihabitans endophyticus TaxID=1206085 RepID=A0A1M5GUG7_9ACTN|nr:bifunctional cytidylyltransferase/SDR family oxidoreductase [Jatrophihabitans endophyticus]SHG07062.1 2-C-methyl-D-erythritol 4-phosphate cytidylyltransferase [Jatrophihabitans endophyticus]
MSAPQGQQLRTVAVVLAGGTGSRVGLDRPKQLLKVAGRTVIEHTVEALHECPEIDEIIVMMAADFVADAEALLLGRPSLPKVTRVLPGGSGRNESTLAALAALGPQECNVLFHDAVRPLLPPGVVRECVEALRTHEAVDVAIASADTVIEVDDDDRIVAIPDRSHLRRGQTPQGFRISTIRRAYELAAADPDFRATDDCGVVLRYLPDVPIHVVPGDEQNMKVTYPIDLFLVDKLFQLSSHFAHHGGSAALADTLRGRTVVVFGGSYGIGADVVRLAEAAGCRVFSFSRSSTGTHVEDAAEVAAALEQAAAATGRIDAVVLSAAQLITGPLATMDDATIRGQLDTNLLGPIVVARASAPYLRETRGHLVLFTSSSYTRGRADYSLYSATKAACVNLAQALADEWSDDGVHVNVVNPERTRTPMREQAFGPEPEGALLDSETVAETVLGLLASEMTGHVVDVRRHDREPQGVVEAVDEVIEQAAEDAGVDRSVDVL